ncbi:sigma-70 factor, region 1.1 [Bordetella pertussis STO1-CHOC-0017]|nr:sigma-70 factor, region 1.1 [Bordetella pertussis STO1-CHOC-0017]
MKVAKPAAKTAAKKTATKTVAAKTAAADKPAKTTKARAKKAEDKLADLVGAARPAPSGRRPGRPAKNANNDSDAFDDSMDGEGEVLPDLKPPKRGGKRGKADPKDLIARGPVSPEEYEARRNRLKQLIKLGKDRGYLTYGEINDHLPDDLVDAEAIDGIISTFSDMGIAVYDQAPDAETLLMSENAPVASNDDDVEDEAEAALTTVDSDFGRTTDPVRMYMREMGSVELLTREGEIEIAKRIEDGLKHMVMAISACPTTINEILAHITRVREGQAQIDEVVDGLVDPEDGEEYAGAGVTADEDEGDDGPAGGMSSKQLEDLRVKALAKFDEVSKQFEKMRQSYEKEGYKSDAYLKAQDIIQTELMGIRFTAKMVEKLAGRHPARPGRGSTPARTRGAAYLRRPRRHAAFALPQGLPRQRDQPAVGVGRSRRRPCLQRNPRTPDPGRTGTAAEADRPADARRAAAEGPQGRQQAHGHRRSQGPQGQARNDRGQPAPGDLHRQEVHQPWPAVPGPDPGRQHRPDEGGGQVRIPARLQVLDLRHVVDPPGHYALHRRPGAHHPDSGPHDRNDQQDEPDQPPDPAGNRRRAGSRDPGAEDGHARG